ncbi:hypothetical protein FOVG_16345 [Fusarium oxysporum f. sp. pisi HDV247]|uniref:Uncharacterized protein n=1 Tax=Fusarium oxysporum f. sp. pisi HDV247 TaxID=1080344 RepID=W9NIA5_FUSOX|nr:hypothetical protein FOVG_16345 [Fusarium oxysporum f. sp. pisi HDV247]
MLSTVFVNWGLPSLGRWDCDANVFSVLATYEVAGRPITHNMIDVVRLANIPRGILS